MSGILSSQTKSRQSIRHNIRSRCQILPGSSCQIHHTFNTRKHVLCFPSCHCHIIHSLSCLGSRKLRLTPHLPGLSRKSIQIRTRSTGHCRNLTHGSFKISSRLHRSCTCRCHHTSHRKQLLTGIRNLITGRLPFLPGRSNLLQSHRRPVSLLLQTLQLTLRLNDLPLQTIILLLRNRTVLQCLIRLLLGSLQSLQLLLCLIHSLSQQLVFLSDQLRISRIQLQKLLHIPKLGLRIPDLRIHALQCCL